MVGGDAYAQDATTVTSAGPSTSRTKRTSSPRSASNRSPTTAFTESITALGTARQEDVPDAAWSLRQPGHDEAAGVDASLSKPAQEVLEGRLPHEALVLLLPVRYSGLGARGGGDIEEEAHRFSRVPRVSGRVFPALCPKSDWQSSARRELFRFALTRFSDRQAISES